MDSLVACNVYISAGGEARHSQLLPTLLRQTQDDCREKHAVVVHAYADPVYNRSSFHLAGTTFDIVQVASQLATNAISSLRDNESLSSSQSEKSLDYYRHPYVGWVDHVAVMPLDDSQSVANEMQRTTANLPAEAWAALEIGSVLEKHNVQVYYYGTAHPEKLPLARVRREKTNFFSSGGCSASHSAKRVISETTQAEVATVGAPQQFVENYNIRLTHFCSRQMAQSLTRRLRERDGGLVGVEALTLPYTQGRWEVACNLLQPDLMSTAEMDKILEEWVREMQEDQRQLLVELAYRVGTTRQQCLDTLNISSKDERSRHDLEGVSLFEKQLCVGSIDERA